MTDVAENLLQAVTPMRVVAQSINELAPTLAVSLPKHIPVDGFIRAALTHMQTHPDLGKMLAPNCNKRTIYLALQKAAIDGLMLDGRDACLVTFNNNKTTPQSVDVVYMPMYYGLMRLARMSGGVKDVMAEVVFEKDKFTYRAGLDECPVHEADWFAEDRGNPIGAWAMISMLNGGAYVSILPRTKIARIATGARSNAKQYDPKNGTHWQEWWKKAALRNVCKIAPRGRELERVIEHDTEAETATSQPDTYDGVYGHEIESSIEADVLSLTADDESAPQQQIMKALGKSDAAEAAPAGEEPQEETVDRATRAAKIMPASQQQAVEEEPAADEPERFVGPAPTAGDLSKRNAIWKRITNPESGHEDFKAIRKEIETIGDGVIKDGLRRGLDMRDAIYRAKIPTDLSAAKAHYVRIPEDWEGLDKLAAIYKAKAAELKSGQA